MEFSKNLTQIEYYHRYQNLKSKYEKDSFLNTFLKEITLNSYEFSDKLNKNNTEVHIIVNLNNKYIEPTLVSMNSALINSNKNKTTLVYHILFPNNLKRKFIDKIKMLLYIYPTNLILIFYNMGNAFSKFKYQKFTQITYYRLLSPIFIPEKKIIYLDSDVLVFNDLEEMYKINFDDNYILGFLDIISGAVDYLGLISEKYINAGVLLINLEKIRADKIFYDILYMALNFKKLKHHDQTVINYVFYPKIGILPLRFGIFNFDSIFDIIYVYMKKIRQRINLTEIIEAFNHPSLMHFVLCYPKVWNSNSRFLPISTRSGTLNKKKCQKYHNIWLEYARKISFLKK